MSRRREVVTAAAVIVAAAGARLAWLTATNYTFEDGFITFQFAKRLAAGQGFVYNVAEPIYGTTTPLFALLMAGWLALFPDHVVVGARLFGLLAAGGGLALTWAVLRRAGVAPRGAVCAVALLAVSDKLFLFDTGGMETPLLFCFMMAALYAWLRGWPGRAGFAAGLLLLVRIDLVTFPAALVLNQLWKKKRLPGRFLACTALTYAPWFVFSILRFGSATPHTITAKWVHYQMALGSSVFRSAAFLLAWIGPFGADEIATGWQISLAAATLVLAAWGARESSSRPGLEALWLFALLDATRIVVSGATFEERYFVPVLSTILVLAGLGLADLVGRLPGGGRSRALRIALAAAGCAGAFLFAAHSVPHYRDVQLYRHETLTAIGTWLHRNTPRTASVLLEPLGYAGYFADRRMIDEVGLVSPQVVQLGRQRFSGDSVDFSRVLVSTIRPDYFVIHCDDALQVFSVPQPEGGIKADYSREAVFNPLNYEPRGSRGTHLARRCCYEIWGRNRPERASAAAPDGS